MYPNSFKCYVEKCICEKNPDKNLFVGTGNPNAHILIIGKESAISKNRSENDWYFNNAINWSNHIQNNTCEILEYDVHEKKGSIEEHPLKKGWGKNTWSKYQRLFDFIREKAAPAYRVDFLKSAFTTEINDSPSSKTSNADKGSIGEKKLLFKESAFIQDFPVVVLACSNYIKNNDKAREIDDIFNVTYDGDTDGKYTYSKGNWFFTHHNADKTKLVIHTRQLSANVDDKMLEDMAEVIRNHLKEVKKIDLSLS